MLSKKVFATSAAAVAAIFSIADVCVSGRRRIKTKCEMTDEADSSKRPHYDCIVIGSGVSGLSAAHSLIHTHAIDPSKVLVLEAQDYVGGRLQQNSDFIKGVYVELGGEFLHGSNTPLTKFAVSRGEPITQTFVWAPGDGGPLSKPVNGGYGLYYFKHRGLLRFDSQNPEFVRMNKTLWTLSDLDLQKFSDDVSLRDYLEELKFSSEMVEYAEAGFANTLCANADDLSLRQCIIWSQLWREEEKASEELGYGEGDFVFENSYKVLLNYLSENVHIQLNTPVTSVKYPIIENLSHQEDTVTLTSAEGVKYISKSVIITSSPQVLRGGLMEFSPPLHKGITDALNCTNMHSAVKVLLKFKEPVWPSDLHGMICSGEDVVIPELWFWDVSKKADSSESCKAYAVGFCTAAFADKLLKLSDNEVVNKAMGQLEAMFNLLEPQHMVADWENIGPISRSVNASELPIPRDAFLGGMVVKWDPESRPWVGGGYCSPKAKAPAWKIQLLEKPLGKRVYFAGEATITPGTCVHAAMESGVRAARGAAQFLKDCKK